MARPADMATEGLPVNEALVDDASATELPTPAATTASFTAPRLEAKAMGPTGQPSAGTTGAEIAPTPPSSDPAYSWLSVPERGTLWGLMAVFWMATVLGRAPVRLFVRFVALYYALFDRKVVQASRTWWTMVEGQRPSWWKVYGHIRRFSNVTLDRMFLLKGHSRSFVFSRDGHHHLFELTRKKQGAILLGAHLGSFEAMRLAGNREQHRINIVGNFSNAKMINELLDRLSPDNTAQVIHIGPGDVSFIFTIQEKVAAGELVAILGDRLAEHQPWVEVEFFGQPARFPIGPIQLAALLKCPIYLVFGLYREPNKYELSCEPFAERIVLPRKGRRAALADYVQRYARRLEDKARSAPDNWFNFYDIWGTR